MPFFRAFLAPCCLALLTVPLFAADELPVAPPDWKVELVAQPPALVHPSVVTCAPDGRVFVAQDPIDMGLPSDSEGDSILCIYPNGKITTFAEKLHAVFGLCYVDGKLYVHHTPILSVFTDENGVGKNRQDLFTTNPNPNLSGKGFNDHIPSNLHLGMDGWLYLSTGDKGIFGAVGHDGSKVNLRGGGIIRFRPDGTRLEIYTTGSRNHLDIAINAEEEMFTYDNTDDGNGWWTRVTHMVDGGYYGYPFDYKPRRPYTLWMMTEYGGGAGTGALAYNEDALPEEYHGNIFAEDWGRKELLRLKVSREGATFKVDERVQLNGKDFLTQGGNTHFRPVGITVSPDGMSFYLTDWNYNGWRVKKTAGRLLKVTYQGKSQAAPKPSWWVAAASAKPFKATDAELLAALGHPAQSVRLVAQRRLADRGASVVPALIQLVSQANATARARWHAIWTLDAIDGGASAEKTFLALAASQDEISVRAQAIRELGTRRIKTAVPSLLASLHDASPVIRFRAATALGRIGDSESVPGLLAALNETDFFTRYAVFTALHRVGLAQPSAWDKIAAGFGSGDPAIREGTLFAMRETFTPGSVAALAKMAVSSSASVEARKAALGTLAELHHLAAPWDGKWWGTQPVLREKPTPKTEPWAETSVVHQTINTALHDPDESVRQAATVAAATSLDVSAGPALRALWAQEKSPEFRQAILRTLGTIKDPEAGTIAASVMDNELLRNEAILVAGESGDAAAIAALTRLAQLNPNADTLVKVLDAFGVAKVPTTAPTVGMFLADPQAEVRSGASRALGSIGGKAALDVILPALSSDSVDTRRAAIIAAGLLKDQKTHTKLIASAEDPALRSDAIFALASAPDLQALDLYLDEIARNNVKPAAPKPTSGIQVPPPRPNAQLATAIEAIKDEALPRIEKRHREKPFTGQALASIQRIYSRNEKALAGPLFEGASKPVNPAEYLKFATREQGDPINGRKVFEGVATCVACHRARNTGAQIGPDLSDVGTKYDRAFLIESVLYPSKQILDGYHLTNVTLKNNSSVSGFLRSQTEDEILLVDAAGEKHPLKRSEIAKSEELAISLMPEGLQSALSLAEFADLIGYLESLKDKPAAAASP